MPSGSESKQQTLLTIVAYAFFALVLLAPFMTYSEAQSGSVQFTGEGSFARQFAYVAMLLLAIYGVYTKGDKRQALLMPWPIVVTLAWCWLSISWSDLPEIGIRRLILTTIATWTVFILFRGLKYEKSMQVLRVCLVLALVGNFLTVLIDPVAGIHTSAGNSKGVTDNWRGFMTHKNFAGAACSLTILLFLFDAKHIKPAIRIIVILLSGFFLYKSQSKTSGGMMALSILAGWIFNRYSGPIRRYAIPLLLSGGCLVLYLNSAYRDIVIRDYLGARAFTGRGYIWDAMLRYAYDNPIFGAGFGTFWNVGSASPVFKYGQGFVRDITVGHNGYLDLLVTIGIPGVLLAIFAAVIWPVWRLLISDVTPARGALAISLLLFCVGHNVTESSLLERDALVGVIMMIAIAVAQNWREVSVKPKANSGADIFAALRRRGIGREA